MKATELRPGMGVRVDGNIYVITNYDHHTPGNLRSIIKIRIKDVMSGKAIERRLSSGDDVETIDLDRRDMEYLYSDSAGATFMDMENYDQIVLGKDVLGDSLLYLAPNTPCVVLMHEGNAVSIELPAAVELEVTDTPPGIKGATATNQLKDATLETGLRVRVPAFIATGERIRVSTADGSYQSRAKE